MRTHCPVIAILGLVVAAGSGCGANDPATYQDAASQSSEAYCNFMARCGEIGASEVNACKQSNMRARTSEAYSPDTAISANRLSFNSSAAGKCVAFFKSTDCHGHGADLSVCVQVLTALVQPGGMCLDDGECVNGVCGGPSGAHGQQGCPGTCQAFVAVGGDCTKGACVPTANCNSMTHLCTTQAAAGGACQFSNDCQSPLNCTKSVCAAPTGGNLGDSCTFTDLSCGVGLYCDMSSDKPVCAAIAAEGASCAAPGSCNDGDVCAGLGIAAMNGTGTPGKCLAVGDVGSACDPTTATSICPADMICDRTTRACVSNAVVAGAPCPTGNCFTMADDLFCDPTALQCVARSGLGQPCLPNSDSCSSGLCDGTTKTCSLECI